MRTTAPQLQPQLRAYAMILRQAGCEDAGVFPVDPLFERDADQGII